MLSFCLLGQFTKGEKLLPENEAIQLQDFEPSDTPETDASLSILPIVSDHILVVKYHQLSQEKPLLTSLTFRTIALDSFYSPPDLVYS